MEEVRAAFSVERQPLPVQATNILQRILTNMDPSSEYSRADLTAAAGISAADWTWAIKQLKEEGKVRQLGDKRGVRYSLRRK